MKTPECDSLWEECCAWVRGQAEGNYYARCCRCHEVCVSPRLQHLFGLKTDLIALGDFLEFFPEHERRRSYDIITRALKLGGLPTHQEGQIKIGARQYHFSVHALCQKCEECELDCGCYLGKMVFKPIPVPAPGSTEKITT